MQRLLKISFDSMLLSLTPILSWFLLSLLVDKNLITVFTMTYPLQCLYGIIRSPFAVGANISKTKDKNKNAVMSGFMIGIVLTLSLYGFVLLNLDSYINFMNMDAAAYRVFAAYAIIILILQTIFSFILDKLYYENQNGKANRYSIAFNLLNFSVLIGTALLTKDHATIVTITSVVMTVFTTILVFRNCDKFRFRINLAKCFKYDSASFVSNTTSFFVFLFGISNAMEFGPQYALAMTFVSLITDTQWDVFESINTCAKIDISRHQFNYKKSLRNAYALLILLYASSLLMFFCLYRFYNLDLRITLIYLGLEFIDFASCAPYYLRTCFLQLNWSSSKTAINKFIARLTRLACAFLPTPFCGNIGALWTSFYQHFTTKFFFQRNFTMSKTGEIRRRPQRKKVAPQYQYSDLPVDD